jgi:hypothetical protein
MYRYFSLAHILLGLLALFAACCLFYACSEVTQDAVSESGAPCEQDAPCLSSSSADEKGDGGNGGDGDEGDDKESSGSKILSSSSRSGKTSSNSSDDSSDEISDEISSSSKAESSSSTAPSSSSVESYPTLVAGADGVKNGYTSRYWDGCRPHCAQTQEQQPDLTYPSKTCAKDGYTKLPTGTANACQENGPAYACFDQAPHVVNDTLAYAFAAVPGSQQSAYCGKCFQIQFDGGHKYEATDDHPAFKAIKGKTLIVMATNIGHDVSGGQFDVQIPGGGVGAFNALSQQLDISDNALLGETFGGLLSNCEQTMGWQPEAIAQYPSCITEKCHALFEDPTLLEGCLFMADWYEAAGNPTMLYKEVECPAYLVERYD